MIICHTSPCHHLFTSLFNYSIEKNEWIGRLGVTLKKQVR
jgi:hypothetical protein